MTDEPRVAFVQDGARLHYAFPVALQRHGLLERVFTPWYAGPGSAAALAARLLGRLAPAAGRRALDRCHPELDARRIVTHPALLLRQRLARRRFATPEAFYRHCAALESRWIRGHGWGQANVLAGFVRNLAPELCQAARADGLRVVADQIIAPAAVERREADKQQRRFPGWEPAGALASVEDDEAATWAACDRVTCASEYVHGSLLATGVPAERVFVNPYPVGAPDYRYIDRAGRRGRPVVGFTGQVNLRKGAPYFFRAAAALAGRARFVMFGSIGLSAAVAARHAGPVELAGPVPRSEVPARLAELDIFFYPSTCEGSPSSVAEAMLTGLPVVTTPNSGTLVRDGVEGFVAAYDDADALTDRLGRLIDDRDLRSRMGWAAHERAAACDLNAFAARLADLIRGAM
jgi:glycosyltransferase involved in cell wall biosynthesis